MDQSCQSAVHAVGSFSGTGLQGRGWQVATTLACLTFFLFCVTPCLGSCPGAVMGQPGCTLHTGKEWKHVYQLSQNSFEGSTSGQQHSFL
jgi:hypothetical protein